MKTLYDEIWKRCRPVDELVADKIANEWEKIILDWFASANKFRAELVNEGLNYSALEIQNIMNDQLRLCTNKDKELIRSKFNLPKETGVFSFRNRR